MATDSTWAEKTSFPSTTLPSAFLCCAIVMLWVLFIGWVLLSCVCLGSCPRFHSRWLPGLETGVPSYLNLVQLHFASVILYERRYPSYYIAYVILIENPSYSSFRMVSSSCLRGIHNIATSELPASAASSSDNTGVCHNHAIVHILAFGMTPAS